MARVATMVPVGHVTDLECYEVTSAELDVHTEVEECKLSHPTLHLKTHAQSPDVLDLEWCLLPDDLAFVPRLAMNSIT